jgi:hypothetical protein
VLAAVLSLVAIILTWVSYRRCSTWFYFWVRFAAFLGLVIAAISALVSIELASNVITGANTENTRKSGLIYLLSAVLGVFFFVAAIFVILNKHFRYGCIQCNYPGPGGSWQGFLDSTTLQDGWKNDKCLQNWIAFIFFALSALFLFITFSVISVSKFLIELNRALIGFAGFLVVAFGILAWYRNSQSATWNSSIPNSLWSSGDFTMIKWLIITTIIATLLLMIFNILKKRVLYFILAIVLLFSAVMLIGATSLHLRNLRESTNISGLKKSQCHNNLVSTHESQVTKFCSSGKYLPTGQTCRKEDLVTRWENT